MKIVLSGTGFYAPPEVISNEELVRVYNQYAQQHQLPESSSEFIEKASGIKRRHVFDKKNILDPQIMAPRIAPRSNDEMSFHCEVALKAAEQALKNAHKSPAEIDAVILSCTSIERPYPAISIELQQVLGISGFAFDMHAACSSATFGLYTAINAIKSGDIKTVLVVTPEIATPQVNFRDRDSHFIFGDACVAAVVETADTWQSPIGFEVLSSKILTQFSNNIRCNAGFLDNAKGIMEQQLFTQQGRTVFKEVVPWVVKFITAHLKENQLAPEDIKSYWLHQANINMNNLIIQKILGREAHPEEAPIILDEYANTAGAGALIAFYLHHQNLNSGDLGVLCSFGAGYSVGNILLKKL